VTILYCHCAYADVVPEETRRAVRAALAAADGRVEVVADLCERAAARDPLLAELASGDGPLHVVACYPRAVRWLFEFAGASLPGSATVHNMRTDDAATILTRLGLAAHTLSPGGRKPGEGGNGFPEKSPDDWIAWYPVIDEDRCVSCGQCMEFCLFGAYERDADKRIRVANPAACKLNCPACARVCPKSAIIFPKFPDGGPIAGTDGTLAADAEDGMRGDLARLGKEDVYDVLRQRAARAREAARAKFPDRKDPAAE